MSAVNAALAPGKGQHRHEDRIDRDDIGAEAGAKYRHRFSRRAAKPAGAGEGSRLAAGRHPRGGAVEPGWRRTSAAHVFS